MQTPSTKRPRAVLFDWDGTLADSAESTYRCYTRVFHSMGVAFDRRRFVETYAPDWYRTYAALGIPEADWSTADARWLACHAGEAVALLPAARSALEKLKEAAVSRGLVTSGSRQRVLDDLDRLGLSSVFHTVVCAEDTPLRKPAPQALLLALGRLDCPTADAVYVGDSPEDVLMARAAGVVSIGIPGPFPNRAELKASRPDFLAPDLGAAVDWLLGPPAESPSDRISRNRTEA